MAGQVITVDLRQKDLTEVRVTENGGRVTYAGISGGRKVSGGQIRKGDTVRFLVPAKGQASSVADAINQMSLELILGARQGAKTTQKRMASTFNSYLWMLWLLFIFGLTALVVAAVSGLTASTPEEVVTTAIFGGLSATTFVATFLLRPTGNMAEAGARAAWAQAVVTTFWTKLGYMNDADKALEQLDTAQTSMQKAMLSYLRSSTKANRQWVQALERDSGTRQASNADTGRTKPSGESEETQDHSPSDSRSPPKSADT